MEFKKMRECLGLWFEDELLFTHYFCDTTSLMIRKTNDDTLELTRSENGYTVLIAIRYGQKYYICSGCSLCKTRVPMNEGLYKSLEKHLREYYEKVFTEPNDINKANVLRSKDNLKWISEFFN